MKIQRILTAHIKSRGTKEEYFQIVLAFTKRKEFVTWEYTKEGGYFSGHYYRTFEEAYDDFRLRYAPHGQEAQNSIEYFVRQFGQAEVIWEILQENKMNNEKPITQAILNAQKLSAELAKMDATLRRERTANGESKDKGCPCNAASAENCAQCRDTDNSGAIKNSQENKMNNEKQIAQAILDAQKMREESYVPTSDVQFGEYTKDFEECFIIACELHNLPPNMWSLLTLANHWYNDIQLWAEDVLAGKNILEEAKKEHEKMKNDIKHIDDIINDEAGLSAELAKMEALLRKERGKKKVVKTNREEDAYNSSPEIADDEPEVIPPDAKVADQLNSHRK